MPIFRVKSVKIYTCQKNLHGYTRGIRDKLEVCPISPASLSFLIKRWLSAIFFLEDLSLIRRGLSAFSTFFSANVYLYDFFCMDPQVKHYRVKGPPYLFAFFLSDKRKKFQIKWNRECYFSLYPALWRNHFAFESAQLNLIRLANFLIDLNRNCIGDYGDR